LIYELLAIHYWYTLDNTVGLSIVPTTLVAVITLGGYILSAASHYVSSSLSFINIAWLFVLAAKPFFRLRAALRLEFSWGGMKRWPATRAEKASERLDDQISTYTKLMVGSPNNFAI
jgi:hypothetical protein